MSTPWLFDQTTGVPPQGYRLVRFELLNWGSFDGAVHRLAPEGESCLLTGANGSGKTTLVDALVTLLVPPTRRHYNQSSGAEAKRERTESSYVQGAYGSLREEESQRRSTQYLRDTETYSVLLGVFADGQAKGAVTLLQARWFTGGVLQRIFFVVPADMGIQDIQPMDAAGEWKKRLRSRPGARVFDTFQQYSRHFSGLFGLRSEKALSLFSQTVGVKVLGDLNQFIRTQMLEEQVFEDDFGRLVANYENLLSSHLEIEKAQDQLKLLAPVLTHGKEFQERTLRRQELGDLLQAHPAVFAREAARQLREDITRLLRDVERHGTAQAGMDTELARLTQERDTLHAARASDSTAIRLSQIDQERRHLEERKGERRAAWDRYAELAVTLGLAAPDSQLALDETAARAESVRTDALHRSREAAEHVFAIRKEMDAGRERHRDLEADIASLRGRQSNIPRANLEIRSLVAGGLDIPAGELPFVGELIRVRPDQLAWEPALEKLLRSFALCVLVPDNRYAAVTAFVRDHDLRGRLVYYRVPARTGRALEHPVGADSAAAKLEIKPKTPMRDWLDERLRTGFDYRCTDDLEVFSRLERGLTRSGLIKNVERHEKDDRPLPKAGAGHVLGWDNSQKLASLSAETATLARWIQDAQTRMAAAGADQDAAERRAQSAERLLETTDYSTLDWKACVSRIDELESERGRLVQASSRLRALEAEIERVEGSITRLRADRDVLIAASRSAADQAERCRADLGDKEVLLGAFEHVDLDAFARALGPYLEEAFPMAGLPQIARHQESSRAKVERAREQASAGLADAQRLLEKAMQNLCQPAREIIQKYPGWSSDVLDLRPDTAYLAEYQRMHDRVAGEDLPRYRHRFRQFLSDRMQEDLVSFNEGLHAAYGEIQTAVEELNTSLAQIPYARNPRTYITIEARPTTDTGVRDLREKLRAAMGDAGRLASQDEAELEHIFARMKELITALRTDEAWRHKVLDVRNWLQFAVMERHQEDGTQKQYYQDSASLSGGEKAKLAYTILGSAIAFQFGIRGGETTKRSFRFVVVDEAFSKVDPENAKYAMELFRALQLQLMVVTPLDKINIVEDYVRAVHYVENRERKRSVVYNMPLEVYREQKRDYLRAATDAREPVP